MHYEVLIMHFKISIFLLFIISLFVGCTIVPEQMKTAERIMDTHPDSALYILQHLKPENYKSASNKALFGLLLYQALERNDRNIQPDSVIDFSIKYYENQNDKIHLAGCYFYKGHMYKHNQRNDDAAVLYLKALDCLKNKNENILLARIYLDMGAVYSAQSNNIEAIKKYNLSLSYFKNAQRKIDASFLMLSIGSSFSIIKKHEVAQKYFRQAIFNNSDSILIGAAYQEIGIDFYRNEQIDSAQYYLRESLRFPFRNKNYSIRCYYLADLLFDKDQYDSAYHYAQIALIHPSNFYFQRDCYRILTNVEYTRKNLKQMGIYLSHYQDCNDSIRIIVSQTKIAVLEKLHNSSLEAKTSRKKMILIVSILLIVISISGFLVALLYKRNKLKRQQIYSYKQQLNNKQEFVSQRLTRKIEETRASQTEERKNASVEDRERLDKEVYNISLHLDNWDDFNREMNHAFNNIIISLNSEYTSITRKEIIWCCLQLLEIPLADRMLLLEASSDSLYKLKQRLAHKLNLKTTKELSSFLKDRTEINN